jgi:trans-aconitate methyltransferase
VISIAPANYQQTPDDGSDTVQTIQTTQPWNAEQYASHGRFVAELGATVLALLDARAGQRILDIGCGDGVLTAAIAASGAVAVGIDSSTELLAAARSRGVDARLMDAQQLDFHGEFDAVFSNAALHWMQNPRAVVAGVKRALKPGGRFVAELGGHGNVAAIATALRAALNARGIDAAARNPWYFPSAEEYAALLEEHGFQVQSLQLQPRPTPLPTGMRNWLETFANPFLHGFGASERAALLDEVTALLAPSLRDWRGDWSGDYVRLRFAAQLAGG